MTTAPRVYFDAVCGSALDCLRDAVGIVGVDERNGLPRKTVGLLKRLEQYRQSMWTLGAPKIERRGVVRIRGVTLNDRIESSTFETVEKRAIVAVLERSCWHPR